MRRTEVNVVVYYCAVAFRILQEIRYLLTDYRVHGIERTEHHHVVGVNLGIGELEAVVRVVLVEHVLGVVAVVEKG